MKYISYYLGQFHPIEENNQFWGDGFTEWHNVAKARPLYPGHCQPVLPGALGFYDLRCTDTLVEQIDYSKKIGIDAFCHWHYWFGGKRLLHQPLDHMIKLNKPGHKFILGWANESWSGVWHGDTKRILIEQTYDSSELSSHAKLLANYILSGQYLEINGKFPFVIYKPRLIPNARTYLAKLKEMVYEIVGKELYLIGNWTPGRSGVISEPNAYGLDALVVTPVAAHFNNIFVQNLYSGMWTILRKFGFGPEVRDYRKIIKTQFDAFNSISGEKHATIVTGWDNTPRSGRRGLVLKNYNENTFKESALSAIELEKNNSNSIVFIKSWNEWAEGNVVEPVYLRDWQVGDVLENLLKNINE